MEWLVFAAALEAGYLPGINFVDYASGPDPRRVENVFYTELEGEVTSGPFFLGGTVNTQFYYVDMSFWPSLVRFDFNTGLRFGNVEAGYTHRCTHPVYPWLPWVTDLGRTFYPQYEGSQDQIYVRISTRNPWGR
jgi:hypothetical protein